MNTTSTTFLARFRDRADQEAWRIFDRLYRPILFNYARFRGLGIHEAEDIVQECIAVALRKIGEYEHYGSFKAWLRTIADAKIVDSFRKRKREVVRGASLWATRTGKEPDPVAAWEEKWRSSHFRYCVDAVRNEVAGRTFSAFTAYALEEQPAADVAAKYGMSVAEVYVAKHRVLTRIRRLMQELAGGDDPTMTDEPVS